MKKKLLACLLVSTMVLSVVGCGKDEENVEVAEAEVQEETQDDEDYFDSVDEEEDDIVEDEEEEISDDISDEEWSEFFTSVGDQLVSPSPLAANDLKEIEIEEDLPSSYDLRDYGYVTPVRNQDPFGTCWSFGVSSACEISILSSMGMTTEEFEEKYGFPVDLSEHHLAYFANKALPEKSDPDYNNYNNQDGEGIHYTGNKMNQEMTGGFPYSALTAFAAGMGPVFETDYPYCPEGFDTREEYLEWAGANNRDEFDWSLSEDERFDRALELIDANSLPSPVVKSDDGEVSYNKEAIEIIKSEIVNGRGVAVGYHADSALPGQEADKTYMDQVEFAQYVWNVDEPSNHCVCIVGYDDDYPVSNFVEGHEPPESGAFICKNSWGSIDAEYDYDKEEYGYQGSGYFFLSYYDVSIAKPMSFSFDATLINGADYDVVIDGYDFLATDDGEIYSVFYPEKVLMANVYKADSDLELSAVSVETKGYNSDVTFTIYALKDGFTNPTDGEVLVSTKMNYKYPGYHRTDLSKPLNIKENQNYSIVEEIVDTDEGKEYHEIVMNYATNDNALYGAKSEENLGDEDDDDEDYPDDDAAEQQETASVRFRKGVINLGESFLCYKDEWIDEVDFTNSIKEVYSGESIDFDNFPIKGYIKLK